MATACSVIYYTFSAQISAAQQIVGLGPDETSLDTFGGTFYGNPYSERVRESIWSIHTNTFH